MPARVCRDLTAIALAKAVVSAGVLALGFRAISDDDYARVVIAQRFVEAPSFDPSGTSWLPLPFWLLGAPMLVFGASLEVARGAAVLAGIVAALLVHTAARWLGLSRAGSIAAALLGSVFPYAAWTGVATVPEGLAPALVLLGCAAQQQDAPLGRRIAGALALTAAGLSRYEAWPVIGVCVLMGGAGAARRRAARDAAIALVPLLAPALWMLNGLVTHDDAFFFLARVTTYRRALAGESGSALLRALGMFAAPLRFEPELVGLTAAALLGAHRARALPPLTRLKPLAWASAALLLSLAVGELGAAGPTHHGERALLLVWLACALLTAHAGEALRASASPVRRLWLGGLALAVVLVGALVARPRSGLEPFARRSDEEAIGRAARAFCPQGTLVIDTPDYGYFAVMAAFGEPGRALVLDDHDPRRVRPADPFGMLVTLRERLGKDRAGCLVASGDHHALAAQVGHVRATVGRFVLVEVFARGRGPGEEVSRDGGRRLP